jgi:Na+/glutamate symporter
MSLKYYVGLFVGVIAGSMVANYTIDKITNRINNKSIAKQNYKTNSNSNLEQSNKNSFYEDERVVDQILLELSKQDKNTSSKDKGNKDI